MSIVDLIRRRLFPNGHEQVVMRQRLVHIRTRRRAHAAIAAMQRMDAAKAYDAAEQTRLDRKMR